LIEALAMGATCAVIVSVWQRVTWEPTQAVSNPRGIGSYQQLQRVTGPREGFEAMISLSVAILLWGALALSNTTAGSIAQYTLWRANSLPHRVLGAFGLVLLLVSFGLQGVQPLINILNGVK
jgi:hypothetical protein